MISATSVDGTEVMRVTVTSTDPYEATEIANTVARVLPERISEIVEGATVVVVDDAVPNLNKVAPSITKYTVVGFLIGAVLAVAAIAVGALFDKTIHSEEYLLKTYDYPILARIPNLLDTKSKEEGYYSNPYETENTDKQEEK
jgi:capsular polysaccharide biosynthesis protein